MSVLVGKKAPHFKAGAVINGEEIVEDFSLDEYEGNNHVIFFFYPKDFTFVCPTELHAFQAKLVLVSLRISFRRKNLEIWLCFNFDILCL